MNRNPFTNCAIALANLAQPRRVAGKRTLALRSRSSESGFAFFLALLALAVMVALTATLLEIGATQNRRAREEETIWRGNQYARAIRLFYHKTGRYPTDMDDLVKGMPELRFLRQKYKNPMDPGEGDWRLIYVNQAGQIIGSTKYPTLQQMALIELNGGVIPGTQQIPGQPGIPVSALSNSGSNSDLSQGQNPGGAGNSSSGGLGGGTNPSQQGTGQPGQPIAGGQNPTTGLGGAGGILGSTGQNPTGTSSQQAGALSQTNLAAIAALKPTGPVDGPVLGAFLTGVACVGDRPSLKVYHGGKKYVEWEFIWNPLEDAAVTQERQAAAGQGGILGGIPASAGGLGGASSGSSFGTSPGSGSSFGNSGQQQIQPQPQPQPQNPQL